MITHLKVLGSMFGIALGFYLLVKLLINYPNFFVGTLLTIIVVGCFSSVYMTLYERFK